MSRPSIFLFRNKRLIVIVLAVIGIYSLLLAASKTSYTECFYDIYEMMHLKKCSAIPPNRVGRISVDLSEESLENVETRLSNALQPGGWFSPKECRPNHRVAIVIPKRGRDKMLPIFLKNLHVMLMKQQIEYGFFVVEQPLHQDFNRGAVFNIGFKEALKMKEWDCFIFHDIDLIPFDDRNLYNCPPKQGPRHLAVGIDYWGYKIVFPDNFGGVNTFSKEQFEKINGFSNRFWNWGGEDDDLFKRTLNAGYNITKASLDIAVYQSIKHSNEKRNPDRFEQLEVADKYYHTSGLNSIEYHVKEIKIKPTHVHMFVDHIKMEVQ